ncbi:MAG: peptidase M28, partial [Bacteroidota bacterium]|nr:peptidase M28 [Bacteroidota bacterium]
MKKIFLFVSIQFLFLFVFAQNDAPDTEMMKKIRQEVMHNSKVMDIAFHLTDVSGPRLTASPGYMNAANWAKTMLAGWGLKNAALEPWGEFGKGWQQERSYIAMTKPYYQPFIGVPRAWTGSTPGNTIMKAEIVLIKAKDSAELIQYAGKLKNKIVMTWVSDTLRPSFTPDASRHADTALARMAAAVP